MDICLDEPVYNNSQYRRKSVFAEAYNPEDDEGEETKVGQLSSSILSTVLSRSSTQNQTSSGLDCKTEFRLVSSSNPWTTLSWVT